MVARKIAAWASFSGQVMAQKLQYVLGPSPEGVMRLFRLGESTHTRRRFGANPGRPPRSARPGP
eukprot:495239-Lingulodinium_polyedra.AAC.1